MSITKIQKCFVFLMILYVNFIQYVVGRSDIVLAALTAGLLAFVAYDVIFMRQGNIIVLPRNLNILYGLVAFGVYALFTSALVASNTHHAFESLIQYISFTVVCVLVYYIAEKEKSMQWLLKQFAVCAIICALYTIVLGKPYHTAGVVVKTLSSYNNPNHLSLMLIIGIFAMVADYKKVKKYFVLLLSCVLLCSYAIILTGSKKAFLSLAILLTLWAIMYYVGDGRKVFGVVSFKHLWRVFLVCLVILGVVTYLNGSFMESSAFTKLERMFTDASSEDIRSNMYSEGFEMFKAHPAFGIGFRHFELVSSSGLYSHSTYIEILSCTGLIGAILFFIPLLFASVIVVKNAFSKHTEDKYNARLLLVFLCVELFYYTVQIAIYEFDHMLVLAYLAWEVYNVNRIEKETDKI